MGKRYIVCYVSEFSKFDNALLVNSSVFSNTIYMIPLNIDSVKEAKYEDSVGVWKIKQFKTSHLS